MNSLEYVFCTYSENFMVAARAAAAAVAASAAGEAENVADATPLH